MNWPTATRRTHPVSSALAEREHTLSGDRQTHAEMVLDCVRSHERDRTAAEISRCIHLDRVEVRRRLDDLRRLGMVQRARQRKCEVDGRLVIAWEPAPPPEGKQLAL